jgi:hypothetical protein
MRRRDSSASAPASCVVRGEAANGPSRSASGVLDAGDDGLVLALALVGGGATTTSGTGT